MNINNFDLQVQNLSWVEKRTKIANTFCNVLFPYSEIKKYGSPDLHNAELISLGWVSDRVKPMTPGHNVWWGAIKSEVSNGCDDYRPIILEFPDSDKTIDSKYHMSVATPPGRPGNPMTILVDRNGEIVPNLYFPPGGQVKILYIRHNWESMGWGLCYPAVALQFLDGKCLSSSLAIAKWHGYLMRNRC